MLRSLAKEYVRVKSGQLKRNVITDAFLNLEFNLSQRKVQSDLFSFLNIKHFTKQAILQGPYPAVPTDLFSVPDSIIDLKSSTGVQASVTTTETGSNNHVTITMIEPGTVWNNYGFTYAPFTSSKPLGTVDVLLTGDVMGGTPGITVYINSGTTTANQVLTYLQASVPASSLVTIALKAGENGTGTITIATGYLFAGGLGVGFSPSREISPEDYNRISSISLLAPTDAEPAFMIIGSLQGRKQLQMLPNTTKISLCMYKAVVTDMALDTDPMTIPPEYEELVMIDVLEKIFELLSKQAEEAEKRNEYELKKKEYFDSYQAAFQTKGAEKKRMKASDEDK